MSFGKHHILDAGMARLQIGSFLKIFLTILTYETVNVIASKLYLLAYQLDVFHARFLPKLATIPEALGFFEPSRNS